MIASVRWSGTPKESRDLAIAIANNCTCTYTPSGTRRTICAPHHMLIRDQRALDGLLFIRSIRERLLHQEHAADLG
jgi:hypothetical protein